ENHSQQVAAAGYSPDAKYAFTADGGGTIRLWERNNDQQLERFRTYDHSAVASGSPEITSAVMGTPIADNLPLAYGCADGNVYLLQIPLSPAISDTEDTPIAAGEKLSDDPQFVFVHSEKTTW